MKPATFVFSLNAAIALSLALGFVGGVRYQRRVAERRASLSAGSPSPEARRAVAQLPGKEALLHEKRALLSAAGIACGGMNDQQVNDKFDEVARTRIYVPGRYGCPAKVTVRVAPSGAGKTPFTENLVSIPLAGTETTRHFGGTIGCRYRDPSQPFRLQWEAPARDCRWVEQSRSLMCGNAAVECPSARWEIADFHRSFPKERGWWHTPTIQRANRSEWNAAARLFTCVYKDTAETAAMTKAFQHRDCRADGSGFACD